MVAIAEKERKLIKLFPYSWISINKDWKIRHFSRISVKDAEEIARNWISTELNLVEEENLRPNQGSLIEAQQNDQLVLQITLQEVIDMIDTTAYEETLSEDVRHEETMTDEMQL